VYNNFPWPDTADKQRAEVEKMAQGVLDARVRYPGSSLADLYDPLAMPKNLLRAHKALDSAVMKLYGFKKDMAEPEIVAKLMEIHQRLAGGA
jgi:response regulator RpfG family c-di-GMP phosphodiesterase